MSINPRTHGLWRVSAPAAAPPERLTENVSTDVVIVGAGYTGLSAALHLAERGQGAVVLEAKEIGFGGSGRNVGLVNAGLWIMPEDVSRALGKVYGERLLRQLADAPALVFDLVARFHIDCELERAGTLHCAVGESGLKEITERARQWQRNGANVELLDAAATASRLGSCVYSGSLWDRRAGTIQPLAYVHGLARAASGQGAKIYSHSAVTECEDLGDSWKVSSAQGSVTAHGVIVATDAYSAGPWAKLRHEQIMLPYFNMATRPLPAELRNTILPHREGAWDTKPILSSFRCDRSGRLIFGSVGALRGLGSGIHRDWSKRSIEKLFPQLRGIDFEYQWFGMIGMTRDSVPRFHTHGRNIYSISGYNGRGIAPGTTFGRDLARLIMEETSIEDLALPITDLAAAPLRRAKGAFYEAGAQFAHLGGARF